MNNMYIPYIMRIEKITVEAPLIKTFKLKFADPDDESKFNFFAGQFGEYSVFDEGKSDRSHVLL